MGNYRIPASKLYSEGHEKDLREMSHLSFVGGSNESRKNRIWRSESFVEVIFVTKAGGQKRGGGGC